MPDIKTEDLERDGGEKPTATNSFELTDADAKSLVNLSAWLRVLASKAKKWSDSALRFVTGPKETVDLIRSFPAKIKRYASVFKIEGEADKEASFTTALDKTLSWAKKTLTAVKDTDQKTLIDGLKELIKELEMIDKIVAALQNVEDEPNLALKDGEED
jgi:hypothetical protein